MDAENDRLTLTRMSSTVRLSCSMVRSRSSIAAFSRSTSLVSSSMVTFSRRSPPLRPVDSTVLRPTPVIALPMNNRSARHMSWSARSGSLSTTLVPVSRPPVRRRWSVHVDSDAHRYTAQYGRGRGNRCTYPVACGRCRCRRPSAVRVCCTRRTI